eukprot:1291379-Rhodomonas_salina.1
MSVPTHQPHCNPPSTKYVLPAGTTGPKVGFGNVAVDSTPASVGSDLASAMFCSNARAASSFGFSAMGAPFQDTQPEAVPFAIPGGPDSGYPSPSSSVDGLLAPGARS